MYPSDKKDDDFKIKRVLQCFLRLAMYPFGLKGCKNINFLINVPFGHFSLAIYPSDLFFLKALFLHGPRQSSAPLQLKGIAIRVLGPLGLDSGLFGPPGLDSWNMAPVPGNPCGIFPSVFSSSFYLKTQFSGDLSHS